MSSLDEHQEEEDGLWTVEAVARYLKVSRSWVYQRVAGGELPHLRLGGCVRFEPAEVKAFVRGGPQKSSLVTFQLDSRRHKGRHNR